jgi:hypothetical protein
MRLTHESLQRLRLSLPDQLPQVTAQVTRIVRLLLLLNVALWPATSGASHLAPRSQQAAARQDAESPFFACPMHPDVMGGQAGKCPKCGMALRKTAAPEFGEYEVVLTSEPAAIKPDRPARLRFTVFHPKTNERVRQFNILHDMPFHLFVVSQDLSHFDHIHPALKPDGSFEIETTLPRAGAYKLFCDFFPAGGAPQVSQQTLITAGFRGDLIAGQARLVPDKAFVKTAGGMRVELQLAPAERVGGASGPVAGKPAYLRYRLTDEKTGEPVRDLQPYLGAWGHTLILDESATDYLHSHPTEMVPEGADRSALKGGPDVQFDTFFPRPGNYRVWSQFQRGGKVTTVSFTVHIPRL